MKLTKEKKQHLVLVAVLTLMICGGLWFGLIQFQNRRLAAIVAKTDKAQKKVSEVNRLIGMKDKIQQELEDSQQKLAGIEDSFAQGDLYSWFIIKLREFQHPYAVSTPQISREVVGDMSMLPDYPYQQATYTIHGTAYYEDLGRFIADFENRFPYFRLLNLQVDPDLSSPADSDKLSFQVEVSTLIRPNSETERGS